jgi:predicted RND superfamily exporter protein
MAGITGLVFALCVAMKHKINWFCKQPKFTLPAHIGICLAWSPHYKKYTLHVTEINPIHKNFSKECNDDIMYIIIIIIIIIIILLLLLLYVQFLNVK